MVRTIVLIAILPSVLFAEGPYQWQRTPEGILFSQQEQPMLFYQLKEKSLMVDGQAKWPRSNYIHPLYDLDSKIITEDFPSDHRHHRGIFWAWHQLKRNGKPLADPWICEGIRWTLLDADQINISQGPTTTTLSLRWDWQVQSEDEWRSVVRERTKLVLHAGDAKQRRMDFEIGLRAIVDGISIGGSENVKGYGGFSTRIKLDPPVQFRGRDGQVEPQIGPVQAGPWLDMVRQVDPANKKQSTTHVAIFCHPSAPQFPPDWILRAGRSMQNVAWPGRHAVALSQEKEMVLRYRVLLHRSPMTVEQLNAEQAAYAQPRSQAGRPAK